MKLVASLAALFLAALPLAGAAAEDSGSVAVGLSRGASLTVTNINGSVSVEGGSTFSVRYRKHGTTSLAAVRVIGEQHDGETRICVRYPGDDRSGCGHDFDSHSDSDVSVELAIVVPPHTRVDAGSVNGSVSVHTEGMVTAQTVNGRVDVDAAGADQLRTVNGAIVANLHDPRTTRSLHAESVNGSVTIRLPEARARVSATVLNGDIHAFGMNVNRPEFGPGATVDGEVGSGGPSLVLKTLNGSIRVERIVDQT
jgi:DUF4097 and DUF4098 domain-containing protein YvlB